MTYQRVPQSLAQRTPLPGLPCQAGLSINTRHSRASGRHRNHPWTHQARCAMIGSPRCSGACPMDDELPFSFHRGQRERFRRGDLVREWRLRYPQLFDEDDERVLATDFARQYHFCEWLSAILLYESTGYPSLVEKYTTRCHPQKLQKIEQHSLVRWLRSNEAGQPDLFVFQPESKDWFFCEVKGPGDVIRENQLKWAADFRQECKDPAISPLGRLRTIRLTELRVAAAPGATRWTRWASCANALRFSPLMPRGAFDKAAPILRIVPVHPFAVLAPSFRELPAETLATSVFRVCLHGPGDTAISEASHSTRAPNQGWGKNNPLGATLWRRCDRYSQGGTGEGSLQRPLRSRTAASWAAAYRSRSELDCSAAYCL